MNESALIRCALQHSATLIIQLCDLVVPLDLIIRIYISLRKEKELSFCRKLKFSNPYICAAEWFKPLIFQTLNIYSNRIHSLKHLWFTRLDCKDIRIRKSEFVAKTQFLYQKFKKYFWSSLLRNSSLRELRLKIFEIEFFYEIYFTLTRVFEI